MLYLTEVVIQSFCYQWIFLTFFHTKVDLLPGFLYALGRKRNKNNSFHTVYKKIFAPFYIDPCCRQANLILSKFECPILSLFTHTLICVGEIKTVRNCLQLKKDQNNTRLGKYNAGQI